MSEIMNAEEILSRLKQRKREYDFPQASERTFWENIPVERKNDYLSSAERELAAEIPLLKAVDFMKYVREGNRIDYETPYFRRRHILNALVLGECVEYKGRFLDGIVEILWQILSEPVWCLPAHQRLEKFELPGPEYWVVDLFAAETAKILTDVLQLLGAELEKCCLPIVERIRYEVSHRVLEVCEKETFWWYEGTNNWSVWCCFSVNAAAIEVWQNSPERLAAFLAKHIVPMKKFMDHYPPDGGCNEGPSYWLVAVGMLMNGLEVLQRRLGGFESWLNDPKLKAMVEFIPRMNLSGKWFMGFSDAESFFAKLPRGLFVKYGRMVNSQSMCSLAVNLPEPDAATAALGNRNVGNIPNEVANLTEDLSPRSKILSHAVDFWGDLQIWIARQKPESPENGMVCCLKAGHNRQSHNHLDLGHFSLFYKNAPIIVDVGRGTYDRTCFSGARYTKWNLNSTGHNAPRFDDMEQGIGREYETRLENQGDTVICDLTKVYTAENGIRSCVRKISFDRSAGRVEIADTASFDGSKKAVISFYTPVEPSEVKKNSLLLGNLLLSCEGIDIANAVRMDWIEDKLKTLWGGLWQIDLCCRKSDLATWKIAFEEIEK